MNRRSLIVSGLGLGAATLFPTLASAATPTIYLMIAADPMPYGWLNYPIGVLLYPRQLNVQPGYRVDQPLTMTVSTLQGAVIREPQHVTGSRFARLTSAMFYNGNDPLPVGLYTLQVDFDATQWYPAMSATTTLSITAIKPPAG